MKKLTDFFVPVFLCAVLLPAMAAAQKCRYDTDSTDAATHTHLRSIQVTVDKQHTVIFRQEDTVYSLQLTIEVGAKPFGVVAKGDMLHVELENGRRFDLFASEKGKRTSTTVLVKYIVDRRILGLFAENYLMGMKLHMSSMDYAVEEPDDRRKSQLEKAAQCMLKG